MPLFARCSLPIRRSTARTFTTSLTRGSSLQLEKNDPDAIADNIPVYPYGRAQWYRQSDRGLYGGQRIQFGNNVGPKSKTKTRRTWHPNIFRKRLYSKSLRRYVQIRVSTRVMRTIDKLGGLDEYLLGDKEARVRELGLSGWWLRWAIMQTHGTKNRFATQRKEMGLPKDGIEGLIADMDAGPGVDAVQTEQVAGQPTTYRQRRLKFRVSRRTHLYYTPLGWQRASPDAELSFKAGVRKSSLPYREYHESLTAAAFADFDAMVKSSLLDAQGQQSLRRHLENEINKKAEQIVDSLWKQRKVRQWHRGQIILRKRKYKQKHARELAARVEQKQKQRAAEDEAKRARLARLTM